MCVSTFRDPRIMGYMLLPAAFRSLSRLSSALSAKASTLRSYWLNLLCRPMVLVASFSNKYKSLHSRLLLKITFLGCLVIKQLLSNRILILYAVFKVQYAAFCILSYLAAMEMERFELLTPCLQGRCSPN